MEYLIENWFMVIGLIALLIMIVLAMVKFFQQASDKQLAKVKEWLLFAVIETERNLQSGTGALKLRTVYNLFIQKFTWTSRLITFETFSFLVDEALIEMKKHLSNNKEIKEYVSNKE